MLLPFPIFTWGTVAYVLVVIGLVAVVLLIGALAKLLLVPWPVAPATGPFAGILGGANRAMHANRLINIFMLIGLVLVGIQGLPWAVTIGAEVNKFFDDAAKAGHILAFWSVGTVVFVLGLVLIYMVINFLAGVLAEIFTSWPLVPAASMWATAFGIGVASRIAMLARVVSLIWIIVSIVAVVFGIPWLYALGIELNSQVGG